MKLITLIGITLRVSVVDEPALLKPPFVLAFSDFCPYYMIEYGDHFLSIQGHPECSKALIAAAMNSCKAVIPVTRFNEGMESLQRDTDSVVVCQWVLNYLLPS